MSVIRKIVKSAIKTLSASELQAVKAVFAEMDGTEGILVASRIADNTGITRSVIVNALKEVRQCRCYINQIFRNEGN